VRKYGEVIGVAPPGHSAWSSRPRAQTSASSRTIPAACGRPPSRRSGSRRPRPTRGHFLGYRRADGRAATRNYIAVLPTVNCSATVTPDDRAGPPAPGTQRRRAWTGSSPSRTTWAAAWLKAPRAMTSCAGPCAGTPGTRNIAAVLTVSLGCEVNQPENIFGSGAGETLGIQELGGDRRHRQRRPLTASPRWSPRVAALRREPIPVAELTLGLQCGGSDAYSGLTREPDPRRGSRPAGSRGRAVSSSARHPRSTEPSTSCATGPLRRRPARRIDELITWWQDYTARNQARLDNNPSRGNRDGGITTIWEKSLGAVLKGGTSPLNDVVGYAEPVTARGLTFMDTPGYDPVSATGMVAGGANLLAFTTGRGSVFGSRPRTLPQDQHHDPAVRAHARRHRLRRRPGDVAR